MEAITQELAEKEVKSWLDFKKVNVKKRENYKDNIEALVNAMIDGKLSLREDKTFVHTLSFPLSAVQKEGEEAKVTVTELEYTPRLTVKQIQREMQGVKSSDLNGMVCAYISALTGKVKNIVSALDTEDYSIAQAIAIFFL